MPFQTRTYSATVVAGLNGLSQLTDGVSENGVGIHWENYDGTTRLVLHDFGFTIPGTATIEGLELHLIATGNRPAGPSVGDNALYWTFGGNSTPKGPETMRDYTDAFGSWQENTWGGPSDLHGEGWTVAEVNDAAFSTIWRVAQFELDTLDMDLIEITIYYSDAGGGVIPAVLSGDNMRYIAGLQALDGVTKN